MESQSTIMTILNSITFYKLCGSVITILCIIFICFLASKLDKTYQKIHMYLGAVAEILLLVALLSV